MREKKENAVVDIFKIFCVILVMLIHTKPAANIFWVDKIADMITCLAVPYY